MDRLSYTDAAVAGYEQAMARVSRHFVPLVVAAGHVAPGQRVLDIATGTGLVAEAALGAVGPSGHVTAADISPDMVEQARRRLAGVPNSAGNVTLQVADGQALDFPDASFDAVLCSLALMFFSDPGRALAEFHRVLRPGGYAAVSANTVPEHSYNTRIHAYVARYDASAAPAAARIFSLGKEGRLRSLFEAAGFRDIKVEIEETRFGHPSFEAYFEQYERGWDTAGQTYLALSEPIRRAVREDIRKSVGDTGGPIEVEARYWLASGRK
jgi:ubiquinone/menaquinone biosynthesis C-methylase UbiE